MEDTGICTAEQYPGRPLKEDEQMDATLTETYSEGVFIGYRHYEKQGIPVQFCFGHGLSYTEFSCEDVSAEIKGKEETFCTVSVKVKNTGTMAGMETVQLYLGEKEVRAENPVKELKAFEKVALEPGESKEVRFILDQSAFAHYDGNEGRFVTKAGTYTLYLGTSSQNILAERQCGDLRIGRAAD